MPLMQWLYFDALECLAEQEGGAELTEEECAPVSVQLPTLILRKDAHDGGNK